MARLTPPAERKQAVQARPRAATGTIAQGCKVGNQADVPVED